MMLVGSRVIVEWDTCSKASTHLMSMKHGVQSKQCVIRWLAEVRKQEFSHPARRDPRVAKNDILYAFGEFNVTVSSRISFWNKAMPTTQYYKNENAGTTPYVMLFLLVPFLQN